MIAPRKCSLARLGVFCDGGYAGEGGGDGVALLFVVENSAACPSLLFISFGGFSGVGSDELCLALSSGMHAACGSFSSFSARDVGGGGSWSILDVRTIIKNKNKRRMCAGQFGEGSNHEFTAPRFSISLELRTSK